MTQTLREYIKESESVLNSIKPFVKMKNYDEITVKIIVKNCKTEFITHQLKGIGGFSFLDWSLSDIFVKGKDDKPIAITDLKFVSAEITEDGLTIEVEKER